MTSLVPAATPRLQAGQGETTRPSTENTGQLGKEAPISDAQALGVVVCCAAAMPVPSPADRRRRCLGPCPCRQLGGGGALSLMWAALRACVVVLDCLIRGPAAAG